MSERSINFKNSGSRGSDSGYAKGNRPGFTLIEVLLSLTIISIMFGVSLPVFRTMMTRSDMDASASTVVFCLRRAQSLAQGVEEDSRWGVHIDTGNVTIYKGDSYNTRDEEFDEDYGIPPAIIITGSGEFVFGRVTGFPQQTGNVIFDDGNRTKELTVNSKGTINY